VWFEGGECVKASACTWTRSLEIAAGGPRFDASDICRFPAELYIGDEYVQEGVGPGATGSCFWSKYSAELLGVKKDDPAIGNCTEDTESRDDIGLPYMLDKDPDGGLVEGIVSQKFGALSGGVGSQNDVFWVVEVVERLDTAGDGGKKIIDEDERMLCCPGVGLLNVPAGKSDVSKPYLERPSRICTFSVLFLISVIPIGLLSLYPFLTWA
jgi:hypothetical protein